MQSIFVIHPPPPSQPAPLNKATHSLSHSTTTTKFVLKDSIGPCSGTEEWDLCVALDRYLITNLRLSQSVSRSSIHPSSCQSVVRLEHCKDFCFVCLFIWASEMVEEGSPNPVAVLWLLIPKAVFRSDLVGAHLTSHVNNVE